MKYIVIAIPGAADHPSDELGGKTPFEVAKIPNLNYFTKSGKVGLAKLFSDHLEPSSDVSLLNLLGYDAQKVYTGRGPLEAANLDLQLEENEIAFRMNFVTEAAGVLADSTAGHLSTKEAKALINFLNKKVSSDFVRFFAGSEYRHIAVLKDAHGYEALSAKTIAPDVIIGEKMETHFPKGPGAELLKKLMFDAKLLLQDHEINQVRLDLQENPANMIWLWGQGSAPKIEKFSARFGVSGAMIAGIEYAKGVGRIAGLTVLEVSGGTGDTETNYDKKGKMMLEALNEKDFVCVHIQACDEASRAGDLKEKISAIEAVDFFILSKAKEYLDEVKDVRILITPCHAAPWKMKRHVRDHVPFVIAGKNVMPDELDKFSELTAKNSELKMNKSTELIPYFLAK
ncbi:MAG: 2,3-bisphosphoglycerate-independent phosphoglycerate mutase [Candidatus Omnitrophica bacterium]|nr:2,3-bisphosphoglycerate-independent phosphoglycerate mutase [Candidatus Omnitrophota bacterium]